MVLALGEQITYCGIVANLMHEFESNYLNMFNNKKDSRDRILLKKWAFSDLLLNLKLSL